MTTTNLSLNVTINDGDPTTLAGVFADLSELATSYTGSYAGVHVSAYDAGQLDPEPTPEDLGRTAYDAHLSTLLAAEILPVEMLTGSGQTIDFDDLHPDHRNAWTQAALAARNA